MNRLLELILGVQKGFLSREGSLSLQFNPSWPFQESVGGAGVWNLMLGLLALALVVYVYRREARSRRVKIILGTLRGCLLLLLLILLNRPVLTLGQARREHSVLAILLDDSASMKVKDAVDADGKPVSRLDAAVELFSADDGDLLRRLAATHDVHIYDFSRGARQVASVQGPGDVSKPTTRASEEAVAPALAALADLKPIGDGTQIVSSLSTVLQDIQGQRVAGVALFTDGRETPSASAPDVVAQVKSYGMNIYPVAVGSDRMPENIAIQAVTFEDTAFVGDYTSLNVTLQASGYEPNHPVTLQLMRQEKHDGAMVNVPVTDENGSEITKTVEAVDDRPFEADIEFKPTTGDMPVANLVVVAKPQPGELDEADNFHPARLDVMDNNIAVLFVDGYPRWDYRYLKNSLLRDHTVKVSCLLTSADPSFRQEGSDDNNRPQYGNSWRITAFPESMDRLLDYDVIVLGDVDPRQFTDAQLQMIADFVSKKGGGFAMVAGPRWSPQAYRGTPIESLLPVIISHTETADTEMDITQGFRPALTRAAAHFPIFRFFPDEEENEEFVRNHLQEVFWYCRGAYLKPGVGITIAEHPTDLGPDNHKAPILVVGTYGTGRTIFSAIDDSWRWRFYTGESIFNTYWVQQLRYLARGRKIGQRTLSFTADRDAYDLGGQVNLRMEALSPELAQQMMGPVSALVVNDATGQTIRQVDLQKPEGAGNVFTGSFTADAVGQFSVKLPSLGGNSESVTLKVNAPQMELIQPTVDMPALSRLATDTPVALADAARKLLSIRSAARIIPVDTSLPLWNAPIVLVVFVLIITVEWIVRKMVGLL